MRRHPRIRALSAGVLLAVVGMLLAAGASAAAAKPSVDITGLDVEFKPGDSKEMTFTVANNVGSGEPSTSVEIRVTSSIGEVTCKSRCAFIESIAPGGPAKTFTATLTAGNIEAGKNRQGKITVRAKAGDFEASRTVDVLVTGAEVAPSVKEVTGKVTDGDGKVVGGATVGLRDSTGRTFNTATTDKSGRFRFVGTPDQPIAPGKLDVAVQAAGFDGKTVSVSGTAGRAVTVTIPLGGAPVATPSATPSGSAAASTPADEGAAQDSPPATPAATIDATNASGDSGSSSTIFIIAGALLVAVGIGAIILIFVRRKESDQNQDGEDAAVPATAAAGAVRYGAPDATRVVNRPTAARPADATMVAGAGGMATSLSEAPTMLQQAVPVEDEFPDPYGVPRPAPGGYAQSTTQGWAQPPAAPAPAQPTGTYGRYDEGTQYAPKGADPRYDEPTGMYQPQQDTGYEPTGGFRTGGAYHSAGGYDDHGPDDGGSPQSGAAPGRSTGTYGGATGGGYDAPPGGGTYGATASGGLESGARYGAPAPSGGTYGAEAYGAPAGAEAYGAPAPGGPADRGTYGRPPAGPGYGEQGGDYYGGGAEQQPGPRRTEPGRDGQYDGGGPRGGDTRGSGPRRSLDWLDD